MNLIAHPSNLVFLAGFIVYLSIRHTFIRRNEGTPTAVSRVDTLDKALIGIVAIGTLLVPIVYLLFPVFRFADVTPPAIVPVAGGLLMVVGLWLFYRSHVDLGRNWSVSLEVRSEHQLVRHGVYKRIRHPMYAAIWLWSLSQALLLPNWFAGPSALVSMIPLYWIRLPREEAMMLETFGDEYRNYMAETGRIFPRLGP